MTKLVRSEYIPAKSVVSAVTWLIGIMSLVVLVGIYYFLTTIDQQKENEFRHRIELALKVESSHATDILMEYAFWNEAYENVFVNYNTDWIKLNTGQYILDEYNIDFSVAIRPGLHEVYLIKSNDASNLTFRELADSGLGRLIDAYLPLENERNGINSFIRVNNDVYYVVLSPLIDEVTEKHRTDSYIAFGKRINQEYVSMLIEKYELTGLQHSSEKINKQGNIAIRALDGTPLSYFSWVPNKPSENIISSIVFVNLFIAVCTILISRHILTKELRNRKAYEEQLYLEATTDALTGISNRRFFMDIGRKDYSLYRHSKRTFSLLLLDIDHFKEFNDTYGHHIGDQVLTHVAQLCQNYLRQSDIFGRIGGEEFGIILPDIDLKKGHEIANRIRQVIKENPYTESGTDLEVTVSIGLVTLKDQEDFDALIQQADKALYEAKDQGRNRVVVAG